MRLLERHLCGAVCTLLKQYNYITVRADVKKLDYVVNYLLLKVKTYNLSFHVSSNNRTII